MTPAPLSSRRRRRRLRLLGRLFYAAAVLLVLVGAVVVARDDDPEPAPRVAAGLTSSSTSVAPGSSSVPPAPSAGQVSSVPVADRRGNTPPIITAPNSVVVGRGGNSPVPGLALADREALPGDLFGVLVLSGQGSVTLGTTQGLHFYAPNGGHYVPFSGSLDAVRAGLTTIRFTPDQGIEDGKIVVIAIDYGHRGRYPLLGSSRTVSFAVR